MAQASLELKAILLPQLCEYFFSFMGMNVLPACVCAPCVYSIHGGQQRTPDAPELGLQTAVSHHVSDGNQAQVLYKPQMSLTTEPSL